MNVDYDEGRDGPRDIPAGFVGGFPGAAANDQRCCSQEGICVSVGVLGHVDSGKTALCRVLSQVVSTCGLDKHPQSQERGITLDLGFSAFTLVTPAPIHRCFRPTTASTAAPVAAATFSENISPAPEAGGNGEGPARASAFKKSEPAEAEEAQHQSVQVCLVDCPGHASLVRTVVGGAHIIDLALLVVDATKGLQPQTAECILICKAIEKPLLVVLNKTDLIPEAIRQQKVDGLTVKIQKLLRDLGFGLVPTVPFSAVPSASASSAWGVDFLREALVGLLLSARPTLPHAASQRCPTEETQSEVSEGSAAERSLLLRAFNRQRCLHCLCCRMGGFAIGKEQPLLVSLDHAFAVKGKGSVVTGTVLRGRLQVGDSVALLSTAGTVASKAKIRGIQRFRKVAVEARAGQRAAVCLAGINASQLDCAAAAQERGLLAAPDALPPVFKCLKELSHALKGSACWCAAGAGAFCLSKPILAAAETAAIFMGLQQGHLTAMATVHFFSRLRSLEGRAATIEPSPGLSEAFEVFDDALVYEERKCLGQETPVALALLLFDRPVMALLGSVLLASRFDVEPSATSCRFAFYGRVLRPVQMPQSTGSHVGVTGAMPAQSKGQQHPKANPQATHGCTNLATAAAAKAQDVAAANPLALASLRVVRRKFRVGVVERFVSEGSSTCACGQGSSLGASACEFRSRSLLVRGLFKDSQHARRFAGFRVALLQADKEEVDGHFACFNTQLSSGPGNELYDGCVSVCLPALAALHKSSAACREAPGASSQPKEGCSLPADQMTARTGLVRPGVLSAVFGGKGKCFVELQEGISCKETTALGGLGSGRFCIVLMYCKSCFDKSQPLLQP